jgi:TPR repeat protein
MIQPGWFLLLMLTCPADQASQSHDPAVLAFLDNLQKAAQGDVDAQEHVALAYQHGLGVGRDEHAAVGWFERAAAAGSRQAMTEMGIISEQRHDYARAFDWYSRAAQARDPHAVYRLGILYQEGWTVPRDRARAIQLVEEAAWLGSSEAQHYLGLLYYMGEVVPKSYTLSYAWLNVAAPKGARYVRTRDLVEKQLNSQQLADAQKLSLEWTDKLKAARK